MAQDLYACRDWPLDDYEETDFNKQVCQKYPGF
jgi:hypothetical protein